jgi:hypothetical protein
MPLDEKYTNKQTNTIAIQTLSCKIFPLVALLVYDSGLEQTAPQMLLGRGLCYLAPTATRDELESS